MSESLIHHPRIPLLLNTLLILLLGAAIFSTYNNLQAHHNTRTPLLTHTKRTPYIPPIHKWHLFGVYNTKLNNLPKTQLQLLLQGTIINNADATQSRVIISAPNQDAKIYHAGGVVPGGAVIQKILADKIILNNHGQLQELSIPVPKLNS